MKELNLLKQSQTLDEDFSEKNSRKLSEKHPYTIERNFERV